ncbi:MAG: hypothetical protein CW691_09680 [Candidatus Bathyarchaeum sp.]|nr:MAG: hypothetical protein CW691_09680 [Candidatus Bathyarchaeum sp.]
MEPKNPNKTHKKTSKNFTDINIKTKTQKHPSHSYNTVAIVHGKFNSLVSSGTVYSIRYVPKKKQSKK